MLRILCKVLLDSLSLANIAKRKLFKVVLQAEHVIRVRRLLLQLVDKPDVSICGEEELAGDLVHGMFASDSATLFLLELLLDLVVLFLAGHIHGQWCLADLFVCVAIDVKETEQWHFRSLHS